MTQYRTALRAAVQAALADVAGLSDYAFRSRLAQRPEVKSLPEIGIIATRERNQRVAVGHFDKALDLMVVARRAGADIDDRLEADSDMIEAAVLQAIRALQPDAELVQSEIEVATDGDTPVGQLTMTFTALHYAT